jgi:hypothetical protein
MRASFRAPDIILSYSLSKYDLQARRFFFHDYVTDLQQQTVHRNNGGSSQKVSALGERRGKHTRRPSAEVDP